MKLWIRIIGIVLGLAVILAIIGYLQSEGIIPEFKWQGLTMLAAGLAGPIKLLVKSFGGKMKYVDELEEKHAKIREDEVIHRQQTDSEILAKETKIKELNSKINTLDNKINTIKEKQSQIPGEIENMTDEEKQNEAIKVWG